MPADVTPFGFPILDLISITGELISTSGKIEEAEMASSWDNKTVAELKGDIRATETIQVDITYPADPYLPEGWLYTPSRMEHKWVIAYREGRILLLRSWTGELKAVAEVTHERDLLRVRRLHLADDALRAFGADPVQAFDWLIRAHALGQRVPMPCDEEGARLLEKVPLSVFGLYGTVAAYAATKWEPPQPDRPLRATSAVVTAVRLEDSRLLAEVAAAGTLLDARAAVGGYTALHVAAIKANLELTKQLLELGANPNVLADRQASVLITAIVHRCPLELIELLGSRGADATIPNEDGFGALHAVAEVNNPTPLSWLLSRGLDLEQRTNHGHTPLQIAAALGHVEALKALLKAGADRHAVSPDGRTARRIAEAEGKTESVRVLDAWDDGRTWD